MTIYTAVLNLILADILVLTKSDELIKITFIINNYIINIINLYIYIYIYIYEK